MSNSSNSRSNVLRVFRNLGVRNMNETYLDLSERNLILLPKEIGNFKNLKELNLDRNNLRSLPEEIGKLKNLERLDLNYNNLTSLPKKIGNLKNLKKLNLGSNNLRSLPEEIGNLKNLKKLYLDRNNLTSLPKEIGNLKNLQQLYLDRRNNLTSLPKEIGNLIKLQVLHLKNNNLTSLPEEIGNLKNLQILDLSTNPNLKIIPRTLIRSGLKVIKDNSTLFEPIVRKNVPLNTNRNDPISGYNFNVGHNAVYIGHNKYLHENSFLKLIKRENNNTNITNINTLYSLSPNENIVVNPFTRQPILRKNLNFVKFVKPNTPNTLAKNLNKTKINNKPKTLNTPKTVRKKAGNAAQSRRTNVNRN